MRDIRREREIERVAEMRMLLRRCDEERAMLERCESDEARGHVLSRLARIHRMLGIIS